MLHATPLTTRSYLLSACGPHRYERGVSDVAGRAVLQRHEATEQDVANAEGHGKKVGVDLLQTQLARHRGPST